MTRSDEAPKQEQSSENSPPSVEEELAKKDLLVAILSKDSTVIPELLNKVLSFTNGNINYRDSKDGCTLLHKCVHQKSWY